MANKYITLSSSTGSISKKFRVLQQGFAPSLNKPGQPRYTIGGKPDVPMGAIQDMRTMVIRVRHTEPISGYGTLSDLESLYSLNDPSGSPSNVLKLQDHEYPTTSEKNVYWVGSFQKMPMTTQIEGEQAWFLVQAFLLVKP